MLGRSLMAAPQHAAHAAWRGADLRAAARSGGNLLFALFVAAVLAFTLLAAVHHPDDPLLHPSSSQLTTFLTSATSNSTFLADDSVLRTGEDFANASSASTVIGEAVPFIKLSDVGSVRTEAIATVVAEEDPAAAGAVAEAVSCDTEAPVDCSGDRELFNLLMRTAIERNPDLHFYRFGRPVAVEGNPRACDLAWRFRPVADAKGRATYYKDYRRFVLTRDIATCSLAVESVGEYHSGTGAKRGRRRGKKGKKSKRETPAATTDFVPAKTQTRLDENAANPGAAAAAEPVIVVGEAVNDNLPVLASESEFSRGRYLIYMGGGERCKSMNHYIWGFLCALGEAQFLNRTLVMDLKVCLNSLYTGTGKDEEGKDFRFYFDFEHLKESASVIDQSQFWTDWGRWNKKDGLRNHYVDDIRVTPMKLRDVKDTLIMRKFGDVEPDNYWSRVCEGETEAVIQRPWHFLWKSRRLMEIVSAIASRMHWDFDSVHVVRGEKAQNTQLWPNLERDTSPDNLLMTLGDKIDAGRHVYIATNERDTSFFDPLKDKYNTHFLDDFKDLWDENSEWYAETKELNDGNPVEFDGYMRVEVDTEVFLRGKKQLETFNDLTRDCKDGVNTCPAAS